MQTLSRKSGKRSPLEKTRLLQSIAYLAPALIFMIVFMFIPIIMGVVYSFTDYNPIYGTASFVGLDNFKTVFSPTNVRFWGALKNTFLIIILYVPVLNALAIVIATAICSVGKKLGNFYKSIILYPNLMAMVVVGFIWKLCFDYNSGMINQMLRTLGLPTPEWLGSPDIVLLSVTIVLVWYSLGYYLVLYVAGVMAIPEDMYEAADIEGAGAWRKFRHITLPMLSSSITINVVMSTMTAFSCFDLILSLTDGGPGYSSTILAVEVYHYAFKRNQYSTGITIGLILGVIGILIMMIEMKYLINREERVYE